MNSKTQAKLNEDCYYIVANEDIGNGKVVRRKGTKLKNNTEGTMGEQRERPKHNSNLICQNCGYTGHTAPGYCHKRNEASANTNVHYQKQDAKNNQQFRKAFKKA